MPGSSDVDFQVYLDEHAFSNGKLPLATATDIQRDLSRIDPTPFRYLQGYAVPTTPPPGFVGPIPGSYALISGSLPVAEATPEQLRAAAQAAFEGLDPYPGFVAGGLLEHGGSRLSSNVRLLCTKAWPTLYHLLVARGADPLEAWRQPRDAAVRTLPEEAAGREIRVFYRAVLDHYPAEASVDRAIVVLETGIAFLRAAKAWYEEHSGKGPKAPSCNEG